MAKLSAVGEHQSTKEVKVQVIFLESLDQQSYIVFCDFYSLSGSVIGIIHSTFTRKVHY